MLIKSFVAKIFQKLLIDRQVDVDVDGSDVSVRVFDNASKLSLTTTVFFGGNYIPKSVRNSLTHKPPAFLEEHPNVKTYLSINEKDFKIFLNYLGTLEHLNDESFRVLLEDFNWIAQEWRLYLDESEQQDLIHIPVS